MNRKILVSILGLLMISMICLTTTFAVDNGYINVSSNVEKEFSPNVAQISFAIITTDTKNMEASNQNNMMISNKVISEIKNLIDENNGDYIKTSQFTANPIYSYKDSKKIFEYYETTNKILVHTKNLDELGKIVDVAIKSGAKRVDNLDFTLKNYESYCNELILEATNNAKNRAEMIAKNLGTELKGIKTLDSSCGLNNYASPRFYMAKNMLSSVAMDSVSENTQICSGSIKINANVNASFYVK